MDNVANVDIIRTQEGAIGSPTNPQLGGMIQRLMANGMNPAGLRTNDVLYNRDWILVDKTILQVSRERLVAVADLFARGLSYPVAQALGVTRIEWEKVSDFGAAEVNMSGVAEGNNDRVLFDLDSIPLPIVHKDFNINIRALTSSRRMGHPLDVTQVALATRIVTEKVEHMLFLGGPKIGTGQGQIYGYTNAPGAKTGSLGGDWGLSAATYTGEERLSDLLTMINALITAPNNMFGPYMVYVPTAWYTILGDDYKTYASLSILQRLKQMPQIIDIKPSNSLTDKVVMVQMTSDVVDMIDGIQPMAVNWETHGGMVQNFKVMCILVPRFKNTYTNQTGVAVYTKP